MLDLRKSHVWGVANSTSYVEGLRTPSPLERNPTQEKSRRPSHFEVFLRVLCGQTIANVALAFVRAPASPARRNYAFDAIPCTCTTDVQTRASVEQLQLGDVDGRRRSYRSSRNGDRRTHGRATRARRREHVRPNPMPNHTAHLFSAWHTLVRDLSGEDPLLHGRDSDLHVTSELDETLDSGRVRRPRVTALDARGFDDDENDVLFCLHATSANSFGLA